MIKGLGYLKFLKLFLIGFGISFFMALGVNSVNAGWIPIGMTSQLYTTNTCVMGSNLSISCDKSSHAFASYDSYLPTMNVMFWSNEGIGFYYNNSQYGGSSNYMNVQGLLKDGFWICSGNISNIDVSSPSWLYTNDCAPNFTRIGGLTYNDLLVKLRSATPRYWYNLNQGYYGVGLGILYDNFYFLVIGGGYPGSYNATNGNFYSQNLGFNGHTFDSVNWSNSYIRSSFPYGSGIDGGSVIVSPAGTTGDIMTVGINKLDGFNWYRANGYKTRMCYSSYLNNTDLFEGAGSVSDFALTGEDIKSVYNATKYYRRGGLTGESMDYSTWFAYWRKSYEVYKKNSDINNPFLHSPVSIFTLMGNVDSYGLPYSNASILEFCDLSLYTSDYNEPYTGLVYDSLASMSAIDFVAMQLINESNPDDGYPGYGNSGVPNTPVGSSWNGITNRPGYHNIPGSSGNSTSSSGFDEFQDGVSFQNGVFNYLKNNFKYPTGSGNGVLPSYIIIFLCAIVFFRFVSH